MAPNACAATSTATMMTRSKTRCVFISRPPKGPARRIGRSVGEFVSSTLSRANEDHCGGMTESRGQNKVLCPYLRHSGRADQLRKIAHAPMAETPLWRGRLRAICILEIRDD